MPASLGGLLFSIQSNLSQLQRHQITLITRVTPYAMAGHLLNTTVLTIAVAGSVPLTQLIVWCIYSYSIALFLLYRHLKNRGRSPRNFPRAAEKATIYSLFLGPAVEQLGRPALGGALT